jgi:hypothetical protein
MSRVGTKRIAVEAALLDAIEAIRDPSWHPQARALRVQRLLSESANLTLDWARAAAAEESAQINGHTRAARILPSRAAAGSSAPPPTADEQGARGEIRPVPGTPRRGGAS